ncbi:MAG: ORF6N domain-containing protein [Patescibacteria group bacterium]|nr:ORF6N domain-containing protein [Patescibacteria group bacterium]
MNKAVSRNRKRFPTDFAFRLSKTEYGSLRFQIGTSNTGKGGRRYAPHAFTEHGVAMLSAVLKSQRAVEMSLYIVRAFIKLREMLATHKDLAAKMAELEKTQQIHGEHLTKVFQILKQLLTEPTTKKEPIGFR